MKNSYSDVPSGPPYYGPTISTIAKVMCSVFSHFIYKPNYITSSDELMRLIWMLIHRKERKMQRKAINQVLSYKIYFVRCIYQPPSSNVAY